MLIVVIVQSQFAARGDRYVVRTPNMRKKTLIVLLTWIVIRKIYRTAASMAVAVRFTSTSAKNRIATPTPSAKSRLSRTAAQTLSVVRRRSINQMYTATAAPGPVLREYQNRRILCVWYICLDPFRVTRIWIYIQLSTASRFT